jgi:mRNA degradation ribonuclease J1/J2
VLEGPGIEADDAIGTLARAAAASGHQVLISTGSQGEPMSALSRIAQRNHNFVHIEEGDTVLLASSLIPGNENAVYRVINGLARWGAHRPVGGAGAGVVPAEHVGPAV